MTSEHGRPGWPEHIGCSYIRTRHCQVAGLLAAYSSKRRETILWTKPSKIPIWKGIHINKHTTLVNIIMLYPLGKTRKIESDNFSGKRFEGWQRPCK